MAPSAGAQPLKPNSPSPTMDLPDPPPPAPSSADTSDLLVPTPSEWKLKYEEARAKVLTGEFADAAVRFAELESTAVNRVDRALAHEQRTLADDWTARNLTFVRRSDLADSAVTAKAVDKRSTDELVSLYTNSILYGIGSGIWLATITEPQSPAAGVVPTLALTVGSVGTVLALDSGRGFHYGVPQSIVSGLWIGLEQAFVWTLWHNSRRVGPNLETSAHATIIWSLSTVGAVAGGVLGETLGTTPGRSAWVGSTALWTGAIAGFATGGIVKNAPTEALAVGGVGLTAGTGIGLLTASSASPSIARVRLIDLSGLLGGLSAAALYVAASSRKASSEGTSGFTALGIASGLGVGWLATSSMPQDRLRTPDPKKDDGAKSASARIQPMLLPSRSGAMIGAGGTFD